MTTESNQQDANLGCAMRSHAESRQRWEAEHAEMMRTPVIIGCGPDWFEASVAELRAYWKARGEDIPNTRYLSQYDA